MKVSNILSEVSLVSIRMMNQDLKLEDKSSLLKATSSILRVLVPVLYCFMQFFILIFVNDCICVNKSGMNSKFHSVETVIEVIRVSQTWKLNEEHGTSPKLFVLKRWKLTRLNLWVYPNMARKRANDSFQKWENVLKFKYQ